MVNAIKTEDVIDLAPRRPATIGSLDARLSVWGQAARDAAGRRAQALVEGAAIYVERVGRNAESLTSGPVDAATALLDTDYDALIDLAAALVPKSVVMACRLLWVDPERLQERLSEQLTPSIEAARTEVRRRQALYRRRARLWQNDQVRLNELRDEIEELRVPRCCETAPERIARGLLERHRRQVSEAGGADATLEGKLKVRPGTLVRWIAQLDHKIHNPSAPMPPALAVAPRRSSSITLVRSTD